MTPHAIDQFTAYYHAFNDISKARATEQKNLLLAFEAFAGVPLEQATDEHLRNFLAALVVQGFHPNTVRKKRSMILPFYGWAFDARVVNADTLLRMQRVKNPRGATSLSLPKPYDRRELRQFWDDLDATHPVSDTYMKRWRAGRSRWPRVWHTFMHAQVEAIVHLALHAGMRRNEIFHSEIDDIHYDNEFVVVRFGARKNDRGEVEPREVPMTSDLAKAVERWLELRAELDPGHDRPWLSLAPYVPRDSEAWKKPIPHETFGALLNKIGKGYELHRFRHTCGTEWLRANMPIDKVQKLLGHSRIQQTLAYTKIVRTDLGRSMAKAAPEFQAAVGRAA